MQRGTSAAVVKALAIYCGVSAVVLGLLFTFFSLGTDSGVACGNAWSNGDDVSVIDGQAMQDACSAVRADRWVLVASFVVLGAAATFAGIDGSRVESDETADEPGI
jgi:hypothetical protein